MSFISKAKAGPTPIISRCLPDGTLIETLYDAEATTTSLAVSSPDGQVALVPYFDLPTGERLIPYAPTNNLIASGCVLLPSDVGDFGDKAELVEAVRAFLPAPLCRSDAGVRGDCHPLRHADLGA